MPMEFCPRCGTAWTGSFRSCRTCRFDFDDVSPAALAPPSPVQSFSARYAAQPSLASAQPTPAGPPPRGQAATAAGIAWIIAAALIGFVALQQLAAANTVDVLNRVSADAVEGGRLAEAVAALTVYFGARLLRNPPRSFLQTSFFWAVLIVGWAAYQVSAGVRSEIFIAATIVAGVAGTLSLAAWSRLTDEQHIDELGGEHLLALEREGQAPRGLDRHTPTFRRDGEQWINAQRGRR